MTATREFREEALRLTETVGIPVAAKELGITTAKRYDWRSATKKKSAVGQRETELTTESVRIKRQLADKTEELNTLKRRQSTSQKNKNSPFSVHAG